MVKADHASHLILGSAVCSVILGYYYLIWMGNEWGAIFLLISAVLVQPFKPRPMEEEETKTELEIREPTEQFEPVDVDMGGMDAAVIGFFIVSVVVIIFICMLLAELALMV